MRARLCITYPVGCVPDGTITPFTPPLLIEAGTVGMFTSDWVKRFDNATLETLTEEAIREALHLDRSVVVYLSPIRELPDTDLFSEAITTWRQQWWKDTVARLRRKKPMAKAS